METRKEKQLRLWKARQEAEGHDVSGVTTLEEAKHFFDKKEEPVIPEASVVPEVPEVPEIPDIPDIPEETEVTEAPEVPEVPEETAAQEAPKEQKARKPRKAKEV